MDQVELVERARQGDHAAWETLVREHQQAVFRLAFLLLRDAQEAQDVAQETIIRAYRSLDRFDAGRPLRPWLARIAVNLARNRQRAVGRYLNALRAWAGKRPVEEANVEDVAVDRLDHRKLWAAIRSLRRKDQEVIYLRFFLQAPVEEVAEALKVAPGTVKSRLHRALKRLRDVIEREYPSLRDSP